MAKAGADAGAARIHRLPRSTAQFLAPLGHGLHPLGQGRAAGIGAEQGQNAGEDGEADPDAEQVLNIGDELNEAVHAPACLNT
ncbi:hypothetical protein D3C86_1927570 [compost metagenome]